MLSFCSPSLSPSVHSRRMPRTMRRFWISSWAVPSWASSQHRCRPMGGIGLQPWCLWSTGGGCLQQGWEVSGCGLLQGCTVMHSDAQWCREDSQDESAMFISYLGIKTLCFAVNRSIPGHPIPPICFKWNEAKQSISLQHLQYDLWCFYVDGRKMHPAHVENLLSKRALDFPGQRPGECNRGVLKGMDLNIYFLKGIGNQPVRCHSALADGWWQSIYDFVYRNTCVQILELRTFERIVCARKIWA